MNHSPLLKILHPIVQECTAEPTAESGDVVFFSITGKILLPRENRAFPVAINGTLEAHRVSETSFIPLRFSGETLPGNWNLSESMQIKGGTAGLEVADGKLRVWLRGRVYFESPGCFPVEGFLDSPVRCDPELQGNIALFSLLTEATLRPGPDEIIENGTVWFALCTGLPVPEIPAPTTRELDAERFFQVDHALPLGAASIAGIEGEPLTFSVRLLTDPLLGSGEQFTFFPANLNVPLLGNDTRLFVHGSSYDEPFSINTREEWNASISSNVFLHLIHTRLHETTDLVRGTAALCGTLKGRGFLADTLTLDAELTEGIVFPQSKWSAALPSQRIHVVVDSSGNARLKLKLPPLSIDGTQIKSATEGDPFIDASLCPEGLRLDRVDLHDQTSISRNVSVIIDPRYGLLR